MQNISTGTSQMRQNANLQGPQCRFSCQDLRQSGKGLEQRFPRMSARWGLPDTGHPGFSFFAKRFFLGGETVANPHMGNPPQARTGKNGCTNFSEVSYGKTRGSYDRSAIAARKQKCLLAHHSCLTAEQASPCQCLPAMLYSSCNSTHCHTQTGETP